jgi:competence protein ComEC
MARDTRRAQGQTRTAVLPGVRDVGDARRGTIAAGAADWLAARFAEEADLGRPALWMPVAFGTGVLVYFAAAHEPTLTASFAVWLAGGGIAALLRRRFVALWLALAVAFAASGFLAAKLSTLRAEAPVLPRAMRADAVGRVVAIEPRANDRRRVKLVLESLGTLAPADRPRKTRVTLGKEPAVAAGDRLALSAYWRPPQGPVRPGGYDFARVAFFEGIGATGSEPTNLRNLGPASDLGVADRLSAALERLRMSLTERVTRSVGGPEGTVAAALVTGVEGPIPQKIEDDLRAAGLSHILSISGLHMALVAGTLFWLARAGLALSSTAALRWPVKSVAAVVALAGATFYLALSGAEVATQRSYIMIAIVFAAVILGRPALSPRNLALAALLVMAWSPEAVLGPSFQMSFAAVAALVAWFERRSAAARPPPPASRLERAWRWAAAAAAIAIMTTLIAGMATAPFAAYHFHRTTPYALAGNALSTPLLSVLVMPSVVGGLFFAPLGLDGLWWQAMGLGLRGVLAIAEMVASWPGSERNVPAFGEPALALFALGICWACLWRTRLRWGAVPMLAAALALAAVPPRPDVVIDASGREMAARGPDGALALVGARSWSFAAKVWLAADAASPVKAGRATERTSQPGGGAQSSPSAAGASAEGSSGTGANVVGQTTAVVRCDAYGCVAPLVGGGWAALVWDARAFDEDCRRATLVVTRLDAPDACRDTAAVIDRAALAATGSLALTRDGPRFIGRSARNPAGSRPWQRGSALATAPPPDDALKLVFAPRARAPAAVDRPIVVDPTSPDEEPPPGEDQ